MFGMVHDGIRIQVLAEVRQQAIAEKRRSCPINDGVDGEFAPRAFVCGGRV
jgi:hypothetical protein